jgi:rhamnosyltransferase subunit A
MESISTIENIDGRFNVHCEFQCHDPSFETVILVNGALATTTSFRQTVKYLKRRFNVLLFDAPHAGQSRRHNAGEGHLTKDDEVDILCRLIERFRPGYLISISWGGVAALLALARSRGNIKRAVIGSFSPVLNPPMLDYIDRAQTLLGQLDREGAANLLNDTVGKYLPRLIKLYNYRYLTSLPFEDAGPIAFHIRQILQLDSANYVEKLSSIRIPLLFVNGELDEYTSAQDVRALSRHVPHCEFLSVPDTGHFLDLESSAAWSLISQRVNEFFTERAPRQTERAQALACSAAAGPA